jgi:sugar phosphate isomerase/epimerase
MVTHTRREFCELALGALPLAVTGCGERSSIAAPRIPSEINGVRVGVETYSYRGLTGRDALDRIIESMVELQLGECEIFSGSLEQFGARTMPWVMNVGERFQAAGIEIYSYLGHFGETEADIQIQFDIAQALGATVLVHTGTLSRARQIVPVAEERKMIVAMHGHDRIDDPNEFATPESFAAAMAMSDFFWVNLDIGHFTASGFDAVAYIRENHARVTSLHLKDRKTDRGPNMPWGEGDTPIKEVLQILKQEQYPIRAHIEYEHEGTAPPHEEVEKCLDYIKAALV